MITIKSKKAFSMVTAIFVIVIMATVTSLIMNVTGKIVKETTQQYQKEQAALLARSYTELAILKVLYNNGASCLTSFSDNFGAETGFPGYTIRVNIKYIGNDTLLSGCSASIDPSGGVTIPNATWTNNLVDSFYSTISLIVDTYVTYKDFDDPQKRDITFHRRTIQKL